MNKRKEYSSNSLKTRINVKNYLHINRMANYQKRESTSRSSELLMRFFATKYNVPYIYKRVSTRGELAYYLES